MEIPVIKTTSNDLQIVAKVIWNQELNSKELGQFAFEVDAISKALDDPKLFKYVKSKKIDKLSNLLFFYVMTRVHLRDVGVERIRISEYVSNILLEYGDHDRSRKIARVDDDHYDYLYDILNDSKKYEGERKFQLYKHLGNYSLWRAGMFPINVLSGGQSLEYFDEMGKKGFALASVHPIANKSNLNIVFDEIANEFSFVRKGLNKVSLDLK